MCSARDGLRVSAGQAVSTKGPKVLAAAVASSPGSTPSKQACLPEYHDGQVAKHLPGQPSAPGLAHSHLIDNISCWPWIGPLLQTWPKAADAALGTSIKFRSLQASLARPAVAGTLAGCRGCLDQNRTNKHRTAALDPSNKLNRGSVIGLVGLLCVPSQGTTLTLQPRLQRSG